MLKCYYSTSSASSSEGEKIAWRQTSNPFQHAPSTGISEENCQEMAQETHAWELQGGLKPAAECEVLETGFLTS